MACVRVLPGAFVIDCPRALSAPRRRSGRCGGNYPALGNSDSRKAREVPPLPLVRRIPLTHPANNDFGKSSYALFSEAAMVAAPGTRAEARANRYHTSHAGAIQR